MSVEMYTDGGSKPLGRFRRNNTICAEKIDLDFGGTHLYPCLSMKSKGAAVQILEDEFWYIDENGTVSIKQIKSVVVFFK